MLEPGARHSRAGSEKHCEGSTRQAPADQEAESGDRAQRDQRSSRHGGPQNPINMTRCTFDTGLQSQKVCLEGAGIRPSVVVQRSPRTSRAIKNPRADAPRTAIQG